MHCTELPETFILSEVTIKVAECANLCQHNHASKGTTKVYTQHIMTAVQAKGRMRLHCFILFIPCLLSPARRLDGDRVIRRIYLEDEDAKG